MITNNLSTLKIHELTREQYNRLEDSNTVQPNEIYLIKNDSQPVYTVNGISPDENGNVQLPIKNDSSPIYSINSTSPDENGNILLSIKNDSLPIYSINDISPDENGNISLAIKNDSLPIYTVNGVSPDENGNIQIAEASLDTIIPETLPVSKGGTGATTAAGALTNFGLTATATELNYVDGVTSNIQTQLDGKQDAITRDLTPGNVAICSTTDGKITTSSIISTTELGYLDGVTSDIQTQLNGKADSSHIHSMSDIINIKKIATSNFKSLSTAGWYRVAKRTNTSSNGSKFATAILCDILLYTSYSNTNNEIHEVKFNATYSNYGFSSILDRTNTTNGLITQIRYTITSDYTGYIEVYYSGSVNNTLFVAINSEFHGYPFVAIEPEATTESPTGVTIAATHNLPKNSYPLTSVLGVDDYGTSLPSTATAGRIFFKKVT